MKRTAIYPGTFDPLTNGHVDVVQRAALIFDAVVIGVAESARKQPYFSTADRLLMCEAVFKGLNHVRVVSFDGLLVDFAKEQKAQVILRGLRAVSDFDFEFQLAGMNRCLASEIETIFLPANEATSSISSTMVREIAAMGGDVSGFVPPPVVEQFSR